MGAEDKDKSVTETLAEEAKGLAVEVYKDAAKPAVGAVGDTLGAVARLVLWPVKKIAEGANSALEKLSARVEKKLDGVPKDRLLPPPATIAAPTALQYALLGDGDEVRVLQDMFEDLLAASMDRSRAPEAHPAFVTILSQLTPDEAWLLKSITEPADEIAIIQTRHAGPDHEDGFLVGPLVCELGIGIGIDETRQAQYLSNLERLGVLDLDWAHHVEAEAVYQRLEDRMRKTIRPVTGRTLTANRGLITVTALGRDFWKTCVRTRNGTS